MSKLNDYHKQLYFELFHLTNTNEAFYFIDSIKDSITYRVFTYRLAPYSDFLLPSALECRGVMFEIYNDLPVRLASLPMSKFFNWKENPFTMNVDFHGVKQIMYKMDGSLISTYLHKGEVHFKSKTKLFSDYALAAFDYALNGALLNHNVSSTSLYDESRVLENAGYTINFEFTSPDYPFRIVVGYPETKLTVLNVRCRETGEYITASEVQNLLNEYYGYISERSIIQHWVETISICEDEIDSFINSICDMTGIEGFVIQLHNGQLIKIKTNWYLSLHRVKECVKYPRRLFESVLDEIVDDLRALFYDDPFVLARIDDMEIKTTHIYNSIVNNVELFYAENVNLSRKDYAIKAQTVLSHLEFGLAMNMYIGKPVEYKMIIKKNYKQFGITDEELEITE